MTNINNLLLGAAALLLLSVLAGKLSRRVGVPPLLLFLLIGMLAGSEGLGGIYFNDPWLAQLVGTTALALILFSGGLDSEWQQMRPVFWPAFSLATLGVLITAIVVAWFATVVLHLTWLEGALLGAIVSSTDAAAVFSVMQAGNVHLPKRIRTLLELESGANDPMAVFLTIGMTNLLLAPGASPLGLIPFFLQQMGIGAVLGLVMGRLMVFLVNRLRLEVSGPYPVLTTALALLTYGAAASVGGSGFLAVYLAGLVLGSHHVVDLPSIERFHGGVASLMEITLFLTLGLLVFPLQLIPIAGSGLLIALVLAVVARPVSVFISLVFFRVSLREKLFVSWVGLRGAVPIVMATFPLLAGLSEAPQIFNLVFFIVLVSVLVQGTTIAPAARWLKVAVPPESTDAA
jgi:cell volume regulation protein A